jgi:hypothetical protein
MTASTPLQAQQAAQAICAYRCLWLAPGPYVTVNPTTVALSPGPYIQYASLSLYGPGKDSLPVPLNGLNMRPIMSTGTQDNDSPPNDRTSAIAYRFFTAPGAQIQQGTRMFRYIPDNWETNMQAATGFTPPAWNTPPATFPTLRVTNVNSQGVPYVSYSGIVVPWRQLQSYLLNLIVINCGAPSLLPYQKGPPPLAAGSVATPWSPAPVGTLTPCIFTGFSSHRTGAPYGDFRGRAKKRT